MKHKDYKLLFMSVLNKKTWQIEFTRSTLITGSIVLGLCFILSLSLLVLSIPIIREYLQINAINRKINTQKETIDNLSVCEGDELPRPKHSWPSTRTPRSMATIYGRCRKRQSLNNLLSKTTNPLCRN